MLEGVDHGVREGVWSFIDGVGGLMREFWVKEACCNLLERVEVNGRSMGLEREYGF